MENCLQFSQRSTIKKHAFTKLHTINGAIARDAIEVTLNGRNRITPSRH
jgi:hypothetical protein